MISEIYRFKENGGSILWIDGKGPQATWGGEAKEFLMNEDKAVFRCSSEEYAVPPYGFTKILAFYG
jgi:hypothetical protein